MKLETAIRRVQERYEDAKRKSWIINPLAFALYQTWKEADMPGAYNGDFENRFTEWRKISPAGIYECTKCGQNVMTGDIDCYKYCHGCGRIVRREDKTK